MLHSSVGVVVGLGYMCYMMGGGGYTCCIVLWGLWLGWATCATCRGGGGGATHAA